MPDTSPTSPTSDPAVGLSTIQEVFASGGFKRGIGKTLGIKGTHASAGRVTLEGLPNEDHYNPLGAVHGGYAATMLDAAVGLALQTLLPIGTAYATTDLNITYIRSLTASSGPVCAEGSIIHEGRSMALGEARLLDREEQLCAHATATFVIKRTGNRVDAGEVPRGSGA